MGILFGPVLSRRLGISLGIDIVKPSHCSYDCIYCEAGKTQTKTIEPSGNATADEVLNALSYYFSNNKGKIDYLTLSGTGEPTLNPDIGNIIKKIKKKYKIPVCLLTNSSMLWDHNLVEAISTTDLIMPSLDAITNEIFIKINRPHPGIYLEYILNGLKKLIKIAKGKIVVEILLVKGINDSDDELMKLSKTIKELNPDGVVLNSVFRSPAFNVSGYSENDLKFIEKTYFNDYIYNFNNIKIDYKQLPEYHPHDMKFKKMLNIRGSSISELSVLFKISYDDTLKYVDEIINNDSRYYTTKHDGIIRLHYDFEKQHRN